MKQPFRPRAVIVEEEALEWPLGREISARWQAEGVEHRVVERWRPEVLPVEALRGRAAEVKSTLVLRVLRPVSLELFEDLGDVVFHLARGCPTHCQYCSLTFKIPQKPYIEVFANLEEILAALDEFRAAKDRPLRFVVGDYSDVVELEPATGLLTRVVQHFAAHHQGRSRLEFLTKSPWIDSLLAVDPRGTTSIGYSLNPERVGGVLELATAPLSQRLQCLRRALDAGYDALVNIAPVFYYPGWQDDYLSLLDRLESALKGSPRFREERLRVECEAHWQKDGEYALLSSLYPGADHSLLRAGKVRAPAPDGSALWVYPPEVYAEFTGFFDRELHRRFPRAELDEFVPAPDPGYRANKVVPR